MDNSNALNTGMDLSNRFALDVQGFDAMRAQASTQSPHRSETMSSSVLTTSDPLSGEHSGPPLVQRLGVPTAPPAGRTGASPGQIS